MKYLVSVYLLFIVSPALAQGTQWQKASNWRLYKIAGDEGFRYSCDTLSNIPFIDMDDDSVHYFMKAVTELSKDNKPVWMGAYFASCIIDGSLHKIDISVYAGFFYDEKSKKYYQLPSLLRTEWMDWLIALKKRANAK